MNIFNRLLVLALALNVTNCLLAGDAPDLVRQPYVVDAGLDSRSISFENPTGERGAGGKAAGNLGPGRKGSAARNLKPGESVTLCDIKEPGTIRHIWMTTHDDPELLRACVVRAYWEGQESPSIECPLGDLMGNAHGDIVPYQSAVHSVGPKSGMNLWLPMPFTQRARLTFSNEATKKVARFFYQIDYTLEDQHPTNVGRLHVLFRRENPTTLKRDFELLPERHGQGRFIGSLIGVRTLTNGWWGEGEVKVFRDGDKEFPTICGTGTEDYVGMSFGVGEASYLYHGCPLDQRGFETIYRWHLPDPIYWKNECRITIQQIGNNRGLFERADDWSCATFWYEPIPSAPLPAMPDLAARTANLWAPEKTK